MVDVAPWISLPVGGQGGLGLLGKGLGDEDTLLRSCGALLVLVGSSLVLGVIIPGELGSLFHTCAPICKLPELTSRFDLMIAKLLAHPNSSDIGLKRSNHHLLLDAGYCIHLLGEALDVLAKSLPRMLLEGVEVPRNPRSLVPTLDSPQELLL